MNNRFNHKKGMLVLALAAGLVFISIIFASIMNRMRAEALITNRVSINERLNQFASAVGRLSIRKLQRDIELRTSEKNNNHGPNILKAIKENPDKMEYKDDFTDVIKDLKAYQDLVKRFKDKFGNQGGIDESTFKVEYNLKFDQNLMASRQLSNYAPDDDERKNPIGYVTANPYDRRGHIDLSITVSIPYGVKRKYTIRKEIIYARLLAAPFCRYTLFSPKGAETPGSIANHTECDSDGIMVNPDDTKSRPMVCLNRRLTPANRAKTDYVTSPTNVVQNSDDYVKNGWIYLGGKPSSRNNRLALNITPGSDDDDLHTKFGEYFQFYYNSEDRGWLTVPEWTEVLKPHFGKNAPITSLWTRLPGYTSNLGPDDSAVTVSMVSYGISPGVFKVEFAGREIFNKDLVKKIYNAQSGVGDELDKTSSMHLFGTPKHCTPTLIFGPINRRYMKCFGLYIENLKRVYPFPAINFDDNSDFNAEFDYGGEAPDEPKCVFGKWYLGKYKDYPSLRQKVIESTEISYVCSTLEQLFGLDGDPRISYCNGFIYPETGTKVHGVCPRIEDNDPYMNAIINLTSPNNSDDARINNAFINSNGNIEDLCDTDYELGILSDNNDQDAKTKESMYKGKISDIKINYDHYLKDRTAFTIEAGTGSDGKKKPVYISDDSATGDKACHPFIKNHYFVGKDDDRYFLLNQIIRINGDLVIDTKLNVLQGGIIVCDGKITINKQILNNFYENGFNKDDPNNFGLLTLIAKDGIEIANLGYDKKDLPPKIEAYLIAGLNEKGGDEKQVVCNCPIRIIGGVAADKITSLVENGCIVEWGFEPNEVTDYSISDYYSLSIGPRDIELYSAD